MTSVPPSPLPPAPPKHQPKVDINKAAIAIVNELRSQSKKLDEINEAMAKIERHAWKTASRTTMIENYLIAFMVLTIIGAIVTAVGF